MLAGLKGPDPLAGGRMLDRVQGVALVAGAWAATSWWKAGSKVPAPKAPTCAASTRLMTDFFDDPAFMRDLFAFVMEMELRFARAQVEAGADMIGVGDAAASLVGPKIYEELCGPTKSRWSRPCTPWAPRAAAHLRQYAADLAGMGQLGCDMVDLDWMVPWPRPARRWARGR